MLIEGTTYVNDWIWRPDRRRFIDTQKRLDRLMGPPNLRFDGCRGSFPEVKRPGCDVGHSTPARTEVETKWSHAFMTSTDKPHLSDLMVSQV